MKMPTIEQFRKNRDVLFWTLHAAGWAAYGLTQYVGALFYPNSASYARMWLVVTLAGFVLSAPMRYIYRRLWGEAPRIIVGGVLLTCYVTALLLRLVINLAYIKFVEPDWQVKEIFELFGGALSTAYLLPSPFTKLSLAPAGTLFHRLIARTLWPSGRNARGQGLHVLVRLRAEVLRPRR